MNPTGQPKNHIYFLPFRTPLRRVPRAAGHDSRMSADHIQVLSDPSRMDLEKRSSNNSDIERQEANNTHVGKNTPLRFLHRVTALLGRYGVETHGIAPIPVAERVETRWYQMFFVWFSANLNVLAFGTGTAGPAFYSLGVRDSILILLVVDIICCACPAFFAVYGPKLGMRAMVQARYSWGYYGSIIPSALNVFSLQGFLVLNCIIGGQTLASVSPHLNDTLGIVIISVISLVVTFFGYRFLHWYESIAWVPNVVVFIAMMALGYPQLHANLYVPVPAPTASTVMSFASTIAASVVSWCTMTPDYGVYHSPAASSTRVFLYTYLGFLVPSVTGHFLGAAFAAAAPSVPVWNAAFQNSTSVGGLLYGVLTPLGGFGKFLAVLAALSVPSACAPTMYTFSTSLMSVAHWFSLVPRWVYILISEGILIPVAISLRPKILRHVRRHTQHDRVLEYGLCGEEAYLIAEWDAPKLLPRSTPAVLAFICAFGALGTIHVASMVRGTGGERWVGGLWYLCGVRGVGLVLCGVEGPGEVVG
ncbi:cytosine-purine permease [Chiua virens]|nr:cytosine-purine permease [Chiua virens]